MEKPQNDIPIALSIAGSDSSAGAGIQADLKTFSALKVYGATVITALTAQNTMGVQAVHAVPPEFITKQLESVFTDLNIRAVKIGMIGGADAIKAVAEGVRHFCHVPVVLDPVMVATSGDRLLDEGAEIVLVEKLFPLADLITPNLQESAHLLSENIASDETVMSDQAQRLMKLGAKAVLVKGGHRDDGKGIGEEAMDILFDGEVITRFAAPWIETMNTHGTGCTLSSAIAAYLAHGNTLENAVHNAKSYLTDALAEADQLSIGSGQGPVHHFHKLYKSGT